MGLRRHATIKAATMDGRTLNMGVHSIAEKTLNITMNGRTLNMGVHSIAEKTMNGRTLNMHANARMQQTYAWPGCTWIP